MTRRTRTRLLLESAGLVIVLVPLHFFLQRPDPTAWSTAAALLLFFLPAMLAVARFGVGSREVAAEALGGLVFGFGLGLLVGGLGAIGRAVLHAMTGEPLPMTLALWVAVAAAWTLATAAAYGLILFLVWALRAAVPEQVVSRSGADVASPASPLAGTRHELPSDLGRATGRHAGPGRRFFIASVLSGLAGIALGMAGLIVHVEGWAGGRALFAAAGALVLVMLLLRLAAALDR
jgi:hypothetical protein